MVQCGICHNPIKVSSEKHYLDNESKERYHAKCFLGICPICLQPIGSREKFTIYGLEKAGKRLHESCIKALDHFGVNYMSKPVKNPGRPTKEFWDKHYPKVLKSVKRAHPRYSAERRKQAASAITANIWHHTMGQGKKALKEYREKLVEKYEELTENPPEPAPTPFSPENTSPFIATDRAGAPVGAGVASQEDIAYMTGKHNVIRPDRMSIEELKSAKRIAEKFAS